ncbi:MAG: hypothetical protein JNK82_07895 [Myxococcaceae bacterium]|nr:hypothetical protein [Myxococcaceae bacterium]
MFHLALVVLTSLPDDPPCPPERQAMALEFAQKVFPKAAVERPCRGNQLQLRQLVMTVDGVELQVNPRAVYDGMKWRVVPFGSADAPAKVVKLLRELKLFARLEARGKLECLADADAPGTTAWLRCSTDPWDPMDTTPSNGRLDGTRNELEVSLREVPVAKGCPVLTVENFAVPGDLVELAPYWALVAPVPEVQAFREQHRGTRAVLEHEKEWKLTLADGAAKVEVPLLTDGSTCDLPTYAKGQPRPAPGAPAASAAAANQKKKKAKKR